MFFSIANTHVFSDGRCAVWRRYAWSIWNPLARERVRRQLADPLAADAYLDRFDGEFARQLGRAKRFHRALSRPIANAPTRFIVFGGACVPTAAHCVLEEIEGMAYIALEPSQIRHPVPGVPYDELVIEPGAGTKASLLARDSLRIDAGRSDFPIAWTVFVCERHDKLPGNPTFRDNLLNIVLYGVQ